MQSLVSYGWKIDSGTDQSCCGKVQIRVTRVRKEPGLFVGKKGHIVPLSEIY